jgi:hypothetical protein
MDADSSESANDVGDTGDDALRPSEALDSDEIRNDDGDEVVDPPDRWIEAKEEETLDERLSDEVPDVTADDAAAPTDAHDSDLGGGLHLVSDDELDRIDTEEHGTDEGQISGTPEDGESLFPVVE